MAKGIFEKYQLLIGFIVLSIAAVSIYSLATMPQDTTPGVSTGDYSVTAKWNFFFNDLLDEGSAAGSGTLALYDPATPGTALETGLSISSGKFTTVKEYTSGQELFLKYTDSTYFDYGVRVTIPSWNQDYDTQVTLDFPDSISVIKMADNAGTTDIDGLKNGAQVWDGSATALSSFNVTADGDYPILGLMVTNEDIETAYVDPRGYTDLSVQNVEQQGKASYLVIEFQPTATTTSGLDVNDYLKFQQWPSGMIKKKMGTSMVVFMPLNNLDEPYVYDVDDDSNPIGSADGNGIIFELKFDFSGSIAATIGADDIDIEVSFLSSFSMDWFDAKEKLTDIPGDDPLGEIASAWSNDWSIGW